MKLKQTKITDTASWGRIAPPMGKEAQWVPGRSAMELARYITADLPNLPKEIEEVLSPFTDSDTEFDWRAEHVTSFAAFGLGKGNGRNHDAFLFNKDIAVGIEGKADEPLGSKLIGEEMRAAGENKMHRIRGIAKMLFGDGPENHTKIRYQLITAASATLLEAKQRGTDKAMLLVIVFKKPGCYSEEKIARNNADIERFLTEVGAQKRDGHYFLPTPYGQENGIELFFAKIEIDL